MEKGFFTDLGRMDYKTAWDFQLKLWQMRVDEKIPNTLIFVEHEHVITAGKSADRQNLLLSKDELCAKGVDLYSVERGGDFTYHGPGQLVGYPVFHVKKGLTGIRPLVRNVEDSISQAMGKFGISGLGSMHMEKGTPIGVWVDENKLCAVGIAVKKWVSFHGFALNVSTDLDMFGLIVPCGLKDRGVTSMEIVLGYKPDFDQVKTNIRTAFGHVFGMEFKDKKMKDFA